MLLFVGGELLTSSMLDTLVGQAFYNPKIIRLLNELVSGIARKAGQQSHTSNITSSLLYQIDVPEGLSDRTYGALYSSLARKGIIPLGLYRGVFAHLGLGPKANKSSYVFTNPPPDTEVFTCDKVYVLSQKPLLNKGDDLYVTEQQLKESIFYDKIRRKKNLLEDTAASLTFLRSEVQVLSQSQSKAQNDIISEFNRGFDAFLTKLSALETQISQSQWK